jgi:DNA invertase Pin-like site-specific DNA recombinase
VVVWDLDRLHRRPIELEAFMALADEKHLALPTVSDDVDLSTAQGRLVARLKGSVAAHEGEHRRAPQFRATRQLAERGVPNWHKAFGYGRSARNCSRCSDSRWQMIRALSCRGRSNSFSSAPVCGATGAGARCHRRCVRPRCRQCHRVV